MFYLKAGKAIAMTIPTGKIAWVYEEHVVTILIIHLGVVLSIPDFGKNVKNLTVVVDMKTST
jgi:hypothetical protein